MWGGIWAAFSLGLIIFHYWGKCPMNHEVFQSGWREQAFFPDQCKCQVLFLLVLSDCSLSSFGSLFSHSCADHSSVEDSGRWGGGGFRALGFPLRSTLLCYSVLQTPMALVSPESTRPWVGSHFLRWGL